MPAGSASSAPVMPKAGAISRELVAAGNARVGVGFITGRSMPSPRSCPVALAARPAAIMLSFGDPMPYLAAIPRRRQQDHLPGATAGGSRAGGPRLGVDVIVAQGRDAGGHSGTTRGTMGFVPAVVDLAGPIPVVAAGGIADGRGLAAALSPRRGGRLEGTRFAATRELLWDEAMKSPCGRRRRRSDGADQGIRYRSRRALAGALSGPRRCAMIFSSAGWPGRIARGRATGRGEEPYLGARPYDFSTCVAGGEGVDLVKDAPSAAEVIERIVAEAASVLDARCRVGAVTRPGREDVSMYRRTLIRSAAAAALLPAAPGAVVSVQAAPADRRLRGGRRRRHRGPGSGGELTKSGGYSVLVDNKPGAGGNIATREALRAPPDGHPCYSPTSACWPSIPTP